MNGTFSHRRTAASGMREAVSISMGFTLLAAVITFITRVENYVSTSALLQLPKLSSLAGPNVGTPLEGQNEYLLSIPSGSNSKLPSWAELTGATHDKPASQKKAVQIWHKTRDEDTHRTTGIRSQTRIEDQTEQGHRMSNALDLLAAVLGGRTPYRDDHPSDDRYNKSPWGPRESNDANAFDDVLAKIMYGNDRIHNDLSEDCSDSRLTADEIGSCIKKRLLFASGDTSEKDRKLLADLKAQKWHNEEIEEEAAQRIIALESEVSRLKEMLSAYVPKEEIERIKARYQEGFLLLRQIIGAYTEEGSRNLGVTDSDLDFNSMSDRSFQQNEEIEEARALLQQIRRHQENRKKIPFKEERGDTSPKSKNMANPKCSAGSKCDDENDSIPKLLPLAERRAYVSSGTIAEEAKDVASKPGPRPVQHTRIPPALNEAARRVAEALSAVAGSRAAVASAASAQSSGHMSQSIATLPALPPLK